MIGDTLTVTLSGSGGTAVVTSKINQDGYGSEYLKKRTNDEIRVRIRHSTERPQSDGRVFERHNFEITQTVYPTEAIPAGRIRQVYAVIRDEKSDTVADVTDLAEALSYWLDASNSAKLVGWES
jgi:hypothetical protein